MVAFTERFWSKVTKSTDGCWLWTAGCNGNSYGMFRLGSRTDGSRRQIYAHRLSWVLTFGEISDQSLVLHHCDNPPCVRPDHLFIGSHRDNAQDRERKFRRPRDKCGHKLTPDQIAQIQSSYIPGASGNFGQLAKKFSVSKSIIWHIVRGERRPRSAAA